MSSNKSVKENYIKSKAERLQEYYLKSTKGPDTLKYQKLFFDEFPTRFSEFDSLYGYKENVTGDLIYSGILEDHAIPHIINLFNRITCISEKNYLNKTINIAINGRWEADGVSYFLHGLQERVLKNPALTFKLLENRSDEEIKSFWYFFYDGPHPAENIPKEFDIMKIINPKIYSLMETAHKEVLKDADH